MPLKSTGLFRENGQRGPRGPELYFQERKHPGWQRAPYWGTARRAGEAAGVRGIADGSQRRASRREQARVSTVKRSRSENSKCGCVCFYDLVFPTKLPLTAAHWHPAPRRARAPRQQGICHTNATFSCITDFFQHHVCSQIFKHNGHPRKGWFWAALQAP